MAELLKLFEDQIESITLIPSDGGKFEVSEGETLLFSKVKLNRHAEPGEVARLVVQARDRKR
jgi:selenoprotein W-related protein